MNDKDLDILAHKISVQLLSAEEFFDKNEASAYAKIGHNRLISLVKRGKIQGCSDKNNKGKWIFLKSSLKRYRLQKMLNINSGSHQEFDELKIVSSVLKKAGQNEKR